MEEQQVSEEGGVSVREIFRTIWFRKWVALAVAVALFLVCAISFFYGYNPSKKNYVMEFSLNLPGEDNSVVYIYPNGTQLYYADMTSLPTLLAIKKSDESFSDIDVETMAARGKINIERNISILADGSSTSAYREITYTITASSNYFDSYKQAKDFLVKLANTPAEYLATMKIDYGAYISMIDSAEDYEEIIGLLKSQLNDLEKKYESLIKTYGESFVVDEAGKTLLAYLNELKAYNTSSILDNLLTEARTNFYVKENSTVDYALRKTELENELAKAEATLQKLEIVFNGSESSSTIVLDANVLKEQYDLVYDLKYQIGIIDGYIKGSVNEEYDKKVQDAINKVTVFTDSYSDTSATVYSKASSVVYLNPGVVVTTGGMGLTTILVLSFIVAVIVALIAGYVAGKLKLNALKRAEAGGENASDATSETKEEEEKQ